jgi:hypothetical protein
LAFHSAKGSTQRTDSRVSTFFVGPVHHVHHDADRRDAPPRHEIAGLDVEPGELLDARLVGPELRVRVEQAEVRLQAAARAPSGVGGLVAGLGPGLALSGGRPGRLLLRATLLARSALSHGYSGSTTRVSWTSWLSKMPSTT